MQHFTTMSNCEFNFQTARPPTEAMKDTFQWAAVELLAIGGVGDKKTDVCLV